MNRNYNTGLCLVAMVALAAVSCSTESLSEFERTKAEFLTQIDGTVDQMQMWRTAVVLDVNVTADAPAKLWLMSGAENGTLYDYKEVSGNRTVKMLAPQGMGNTVYIVSLCDRNKEINAIKLTGQTEQSVDIELSSVYNPSYVKPAKAAPVYAPEAAPKATDKASLYGSSIIGGAKYNQFTNDQTYEALELLGNYYIEYMPAKNLGLNCDYELESNGDFDITWFAGNSMSSTAHVLGYYYHSPGTYDDIKYVDISETEIYDYIDGLAKVQYQVNDNAASEYGVKANYWYDANFDMGDTFESPRPNLAVRRNDDAYNTIDVFKRYGSDISALRGISFTVKVPKGMRVGFYDRVEDVSLPTQYDRLVRLGIKPYTTRDKFKAMNFTAEALNQNLNQKGSYRSCIVPNAYTDWIGMENDYTGGDLDCNDVIFGISADLDIHRPDIVVPDIEPSADYDDKMPWTIAYEDVYRGADFDFNDAVIKILPDYESEKCCVTVMATGSTDKMYLHYDGPDGDIILGEMHELLGTSVNKRVNTETANAETPFVMIDCVNWPKEYTIDNDAKRFYIEVQRGTCKDCSDIISLPDSPGQMPQAILVAGEWKWPREGVHINTAYDTFASWSKNVTKMAYWSWYSYINYNMCVNY